MKKKNLLLTFLIAATFLLGGGAMGQTVTIGSGTTTSYNLPSRNSLNYGYSQQIYTANELTTAGGYAGYITSVAFYNNTSYTPTRSFNIYLVNTNKSTFSDRTDWIAVSSGNQVFSGSVTFAANNWTTINFTSSFTWDGTSNIALIIDDNTNSGGVYATYYVFSASSQSIYCEGATDLDPSNPPTSGTYSYWQIDNIKNIVQFEFEPTSSCSKPKNLNCINLTSNTVTFNWTENGTADTWQMVYSTNPDFAPNSATPIIVTTKPYTLRSLTTGTTYYAYVRAYCDAENQSAWSNKCEFTPSTNVTLTANDGTMTNYSVPVYYYSIDNASYDFRSQFIIPSSNLNVMKGGKIQKITFYNNSASLDYGDAEFDVYLGEVNYTTIESFCDWSNLTKVYSGGITVNIDKEMELSLSTAYTYQGGNLLIGFYRTKKGTKPTYDTWYGISTSYNSSIYATPSNASAQFIPKTTFSYTPAITFATEGNWNVTDNWYGNVPTSSDNVLITAAVTIPNGYTATANNITIDGGSLTIADGGQLICNNSVAATVQKNIGSWASKDASGWNFIASPIAANVDPTTVTNMINATATKYDLYRLNMGTAVSGNEWENYKNVDHAPFTLENGRGYLYANADGVDLAFSGDIQPSNTTVTKSGLYEGYNLVGNPFTCNAYLNRFYYTLNGDGSAIVVDDPKSAPIAPCTGVIIENSSVTFSKNSLAVESSNNGNVQMVLSQNVTTRGESTAKTLDKAIVSFNEDDQLGKFYFGNQDANLYIPMENEEYAIVSSSAQGEMPVNFKAHRDGQYTITVNPQEVEMGYLHLVDNIAGTDIDLLATPSYTFNAKADDYESRFRLVFSANMVNADLNDDFAFFSNGQLVIANEGESLLQVIDVNGRIVTTESVSGTCSKAINVKAGVYVLRLIQGTDVKTQKIIVK